MAKAAKHNQGAKPEDQIQENQNPGADQNQSGDASNQNESANENAGDQPSSEAGKKEKSKAGENAAKAATPSRAPKGSKGSISDKTFSFKGKTYKVLIPKMNIPEIGERTALEVCADPEAQQALIDRNCIGSVLEEVAE